MKRLRVILIAAIVLALGGLAIYFTAPREPAYQGKKLSWWLERYEQKQRDGGAWDSDPFAEESDEALKAIGTKAIPTLLKWAQANRSPFKDKINSFLVRHRVTGFRFEDHYEKRLKAMAGFKALGADAMPAVPALTQIVNSSPHGQCGVAFESLILIDEDKKTLLPIIIQSLRRKDIKFKAALYIHCTYPERARQLGVYEVEPMVWHLPTNTFSKLERSIFE